MGQSQSVPELSKVLSSCQSASSLDSSVSSSAKRRSRVTGLPISFPDDLTNCRDGEVKVKSLGIYMEPLPSKQPLALPVTAFTHHSLIINVDCVEMPDGREEKPGFIMAEKGNGGIIVQCLRVFRPRDYEEKRVCRLVGDCGTIPMQKVLDILEEPSSDYCFLTENCWKYADQTFRGLVEEFSNRAEPESETKKNLQSYLKALPPLRMPGDAFKWSCAEVLGVSATPVFMSGTYFTRIAYLAVSAVSAVSAASIGTAVLCLGRSPTPLAGPIALQVARKFAAASAVTSFPGAVAANHFSAATLSQLQLYSAAMKVGGGAAAGVHTAALPTAALSKASLVAAVTALGSPHVLWTGLAVVGGGVGGLGLAWFAYKLFRGSMTGCKDDMTPLEFVKYIFKGCWQCLCFGLKWIGKGIFPLFESFFESIASSFQGRRVNQMEISGGDTEPLRQLLDGHTESEGTIDSFNGH